MLWWLEWRGWAPRVHAEWTPNQMIGNAVQAGLKAAYDAWPNRLLSRGGEAAEGVLAAEYVEQDTWTWDACQALVRRGLHLALDGPLLDGVQSIVLNEQDVYGRRPDVVVRKASGLGVWDTKVALSLDTRNRSHRLAEYDHAWQIRDYAYHVSQYLAEPVVEGGYQLIILGPRKDVVLHTVDVTPPTLAHWYESARSVWSTMWAVETGQQQPWMNLTACTSRSAHYGQPRCPMYDACHLYHGDERAMATLYERTVR